jgi:hypothetical protein
MAKILVGVTVCTSGLHSMTGRTVIIGDGDMGVMGQLVVLGGVAAITGVERLNYRFRTRNS